MNGEQNTEQKPETKDAESEERPKETIREIHHHHYHEKISGFSFSRLLVGVLIICVGLAFLGHSLGWFTANFNWWNLWPIVIIIVGLLFLTGRGWISAIIGIAVTLLVIGVIALLIFGNPQWSSNEATTQSISINKEVNVQSAAVDLKFGAGKINIAGGSDILVSGTLESNFMKLNKDSEVQDGVQKINLRGEGSWRGFGRTTNNLNLNLSNDIPMKLNIDTGAVDANFDLSGLMAESIDINTGASSLKVALGDKLDKSELKIKAGASSVDITLPRTAGVKLRISSGLTSKDLKDFKQIDSNNYETDNYQSATKKIDMDFDLGATSLKIDWR